MVHDHNVYSLSHHFSKGNQVDFQSGTVVLHFVCDSGPFPTDLDFDSDDLPDNKRSNLLFKSVIHCCLRSRDLAICYKLLQ